MFFVTSKWINGWGLATTFMMHERRPYELIDCTIMGESRGSTGRGARPSCIIYSFFIVCAAALMVLVAYGERIMSSGRKRNMSEDP